MESYPPEVIDLILKVALAVGAAGTWLYDNLRTASLQRLNHRVTILRHLGELPNVRADLLAPLRTSVEKEVGRRFPPSGEGRLALAAPGFLVSVVGLGLAWVFFYFKAGEELSFLRLVGGLFFGLVWGVMGAVVAVLKLFRLG